MDTCQDRCRKRRIKDLHRPGRQTDSGGRPSARSPEKGRGRFLEPRQRPEFRFLVGGIFERLHRQAGNKKATVAIARRLLLVIFAMLRDGTEFKTA